MTSPANFRNLKLPAIVAPMFLTSGPDLVVACCNAGLIGTFPALNQRSTEGFGRWLDEIGERLAPTSAPYGVNLIVHRSNSRLQADLAEVVRRKTPLVITSLGAVRELVDAVHAYGGVVFHDVISRRHAEKAAEAGVDGIIGVAAGAGGHAGLMSPFALVSEIRQVFSGTIVLSGAMNTGAQIAAARMMGADMAYLGTRFIATKEATAADAHKALIVESRMSDIMYTPNISGVAANFLTPSIRAAGLDPANLPAHAELDMMSEAKAWSRIWSAGHGVGGVDDMPAAADLCARLIEEYRAAMRSASADPFVQAAPPFRDELTQDFHLT
ncbi:nitronate monooxygenase family protein [Terrarubrum flagellatum]|uniref:NAD(P)H-dependent flavin oxidoreductase n=1 Tax=Terrirubrum flagellatum TaxID=2895980 RepID=UPI003145130C